MPIELKTVLVSEAGKELKLRAGEVTVKRQLWVIRDLIQQCS